MTNQLSFTAAGQTLGYRFARFTHKEGKVVPLLTGIYGLMNGDYYLTPFRYECCTRHHIVCAVDGDRHNRQVELGGKDIRATLEAVKFTIAGA